LRKQTDLKSTFSLVSEKIYVIPPHRTRYLSEIAESNRHYDETALTQEQVAQNVKTIETVSGKVPVITKSGIDDASVLPTARI
jgi:methylmalonyl-CoA mutase